MIGKPEWFKRRKYTGWGFSPATWQGWVYIFVVILPIILITNIPGLGKTGLVITIIWAIVACIDFVDIAIRMPKDERDRIHEAIAERNALWVIIAVLTIGIGYQVASGIIKNAIEIDPVIIIAIFAGLIAKIISNIYLDKRD